MDLHSGLPFWLIKSGLPFNYYPLTTSLETQVVILGGGISGALMAYHLTEAGISCVLLDARTIGLGSTCASTALLQYELDTPLSKLKDTAGIKNAARAYHICLEAIDKLGAIAKQIQFDEFACRNSLYYAAARKDAAFLKEEYTIRKQQQFNVEYLDKAAVKKEYGFAAPAAICSYHGAQVNAYMFTHRLLQYAISKGLQVYDRTSATAIKHAAKYVQLKTSNGCRIKANKLVYATGYESVQYIDKKIATLYSTYAIISENMIAEKPFWKDDALIWNTGDPYLYLRTTSDNRIICGGRDELFSTGAKQEDLITAKTKQLTKDFSQLFPGITFKPEFSWAGIFASTKDGLPFIGTYKKLPNSYFALGFGGNGITFSQAAAEIICDMILEKKNNDAGIFSFERI